MTRDKKIQNDIHTKIQQLVYRAENQRLKAIDRDILNAIPVLTVAPMCGLKWIKVSKGTWKFIDKEIIENPEDESPIQVKKHNLLKTY